MLSIGIDGIGQLLGFWESTNIMCVVTGLIVGIVCGVSIGIIIDEIKTIRPFKKQKVVKNRKSFGDEVREG